MRRIIIVGAASVALLAGCQGLEELGKLNPVGAYQLNKKIEEGQAQKLARLKAFHEDECAAGDQSSCATVLQYEKMERMNRAMEGR